MARGEGQNDTGHVLEESSGRESDRDTHIAREESDPVNGEPENPRDVLEELEDQMATKDLIKIWNSQEATKHTQQPSIELNRRLKRQLDDGWTMEEIAEAIRTWSEVVMDPNEWFDSRDYTLSTFLKKRSGELDPLERFAKWESSDEQNRYEDPEDLPPDDVLMDMSQNKRLEVLRQVYPDSKDPEVSHFA